MINVIVPIFVGYGPITTAIIVIVVVMAIVGDQLDHLMTSCCGPWSLRLVDRSGLLEPQKLEVQYRGASLPKHWAEVDALQPTRSVDFQWGNCFFFGGALFIDAFCEETSGWWCLWIVRPWVGDPFIVEKSDSKATLKSKWWYFNREIDQIRPAIGHQTTPRLVGLRNIFQGRQCLTTVVMTVKKGMAIS